MVLGTLQRTVRGSPRLKERGGGGISSPLCKETEAWRDLGAHPQACGELGALVQTTELGGGLQHVVEVQRRPPHSELMQP